MTRLPVCAFIIAFALPVSAPAYAKPETAVCAPPVADSLKAAKAAYARGDVESGGRLLSAAAELGDPEAQLALAWLYGQGWGGFPDDDERALALTRAAAAQDYAPAVLQMGWDTSGPESAGWILKAAALGNIEAQVKAAEMYAMGDEGRGVAEDDAEAARWLRKAADQGDADAAYDLSASYRRGRGVEKNLDEALRWLKLAAERGSTNARAELGQRYAKGDGLPMDEVQAYRWLAAATWDREPSVFDQPHFDLRDQLRARLGEAERTEADRWAVGQPKAARYPNPRDWLPQE